MGLVRMATNAIAVRGAANRIAKRHNTGEHRLGGPVVPITIDASDFFKVSKRLKAAGGELRKEVLKEIRTAAKPLIEETRDAARSSLPSSGGLAESIARTPQRVQTRTGAKTAGVRIVAGGKGGAARTTDQGFVRHPVYGRGPFVRQNVPGGWFADTLNDKAPEVRKDIADVLEDAVKRLARPL